LSKREHVVKAFGCVRSWSLGSRKGKRGTKY